MATAKAPAQVPAPQMFPDAERMVKGKVNMTISQKDGGDGAGGSYQTANPSW